MDGFRYLARNNVVLMSFVVDLIAMVLGMPRALFPQIASADFGGPVEGGAIIALLAAAMVGFGVAVAHGDGKIGPALWVALAFLAVGGAADMVSAAFRSTILQQVASDEIRGRLASGAPRPIGGYRPRAGAPRRNRLPFPIHTQSG